MAVPEPTPASAITIDVVGSESGLYAMFDVVAVTAQGATLTGPLMLEVGERLTLRVSKGTTSVDVSARVASVRRGDGHGEPTTDVSFDDGGKLASIVA